MLESTDTQLEKKRFVISPESIAGMKRLRGCFLELKQQYPFLSGLGFFGSRTKGKENEKSDFDICIFYDSSKIHLPTQKRREDWDQIKTKLGKQINTHLDWNLLNEPPTVIIDINPEITRNDFELFIQSATPFINRDVNSLGRFELLINRIGSISIHQLYLRFILAVGDEVYSNRRYILEQFKTTPNGDKYFQIFMKLLALHERGTEVRYSVPTYTHYPQTIEQAEKYFLTKSAHGASPDQTTPQAQHFLEEVGRKWDRFSIFGGFSGFSGRS